MKKSILVLAMSLSSAPVFAADLYQCFLAPGSYNDFGDTFIAAVTARTIKLSEFKTDAVSSVKGKLDKTYTPRPQNAGSIRFLADVETYGGGTGCDHGEVILNKSMANGGNGRLTIVYDCDSDGTGPIFYRYNCLN